MDTRIVPMERMSPTAPRSPVPTTSLSAQRAARMRPRSASTRTSCATATRTVTTAPTSERNAVSFSSSCFRCHLGSPLSFVIFFANEGPFSKTHSSDENVALFFKKPSANLAAFFVLADHDELTAIKGGRMVASSFLTFAL